MQIDEEREVWQENIKQQLIKIFDKPEQMEDLLRILHFLVEEEKAYRMVGSDEIPPVWMTLKTLIGKEQLFRAYSLHLAEATKAPERNAEFLKNVEGILMQGNDENGNMFEDEQDEVKKQLIEEFKDELDELFRIFHCLEEEDRRYRHVTYMLPPIREKLESALRCSKALFRSYARQLAEDTRDAAKNPTFLKAMLSMYNSMLTVSVRRLPSDHAQGAGLPDAQLVANVGYCATVALAAESSVVPVFNIVAKAIGTATAGKVALSVADETLQLVAKVSGPAVAFFLAAVYLSYATVRNIYRWYKGEITSKRCAKNIIDATASVVGGGIGVGAAGAAIGTVICPGIGTIIGGVLGSIIGTIGVGMASSFLTQKIFGIPKEEAVENAYNYLGIHQSASNDTVNKAFRKLCLQHHPDKGGSKEEFFKLQAFMTVIKVSRGEQFPDVA